MRDDHTRDGRGEVGAGGGGKDACEVRVALIIVVAHVHAAVEHDTLPADGHHHAALPHLLPRPCNTYVQRLTTSVWFRSIKPCETKWLVGRLPSTRQSMVMSGWPQRAHSGERGGGAVPLGGRA